LDEVEWWFKKCAKFTHENLLKELEVTALSDYKNIMRMEYSTFMELLDMVTPIIQKDTTVMRDANPASQRHCDFVFSCNRTKI
jgi:hypothetical protein